MHSRILRNLGACALLLATVAVLAAAGCGGGDDDPGSQEDIQEVEDVTRQVFAATGEEAEFFFAHVTDNLIETVLFSDRTECEAAAAECIGDGLPIESISSIEVGDETGSLAAVIEFFGPAGVGLIREDNVWKVDSMNAGSDEVPEGATAVDLDLYEFRFIFEQEEIPTGGNFGFAVTNGGVQAHEVVVISVPEGGDVDEAIAAVAEETEPPVAFKVFIQPGQEIDMALESPLEPGTYALAYFFPDTDDPELAPHIEKGMVAEFTVQ